MFDVRAMDTRDDHEIAVEAYDDPMSPDYIVKLTDSTQIPYRTIYLTVAEARKLAMFLDHAADEASMLNEMDQADA